MWNRIIVDKTFITHTHTHTHTHTYHGVVAVWPPAHQVMADVCKGCELQVREPF